jgi:phage/plasmid-like protein (TIGR03299 family)
MAYANETPWHGLGHKLAAHQPLEIWAERAGMNWRIEESEVRFVAGNGSDTKGLGSIHAFPDQKVLYRSDTKVPLSVVSNRYQVVQPSEILEFYRDLTEVGGYELETAGVLKEGRKFWALARTGQSAVLKGKDQVHGYLLLATACDGTLATTAQFTSVRVVCNNTLAIALGEGKGAVKVHHRSQFDAQAVKRQLGVAISSWDDFMVRMKALSECKVNAAASEAFFRRVLTCATSEPIPDARTGWAMEGRSATTPKAPSVNDRALKSVQALYAGRGKGAHLASASGTAWGVLQSVIEHVDHHRRARSEDHRRDAAWFGAGATVKQKAWDEAMKLVA